MRKIFKYFFTLCVCILTSITFIAPANSFNYEYIWTNNYRSESNDLEIYMMGPSFIFYGGIDRYLIPFIVLRGNKIVYKGIAESSVDMEATHVLKRVCEENNNAFSNDDKLEIISKLCSNKGSISKYESEEIFTSEVNPMYLGATALTAYHKYFTFTVTMGSHHGNSNAQLENDTLEVKLAPNAGDVPDWVKSVLGNYIGGLG